MYLPFWNRAMKTVSSLPDGVDDFTLDRDGPSSAEIDGWQVTPERDGASISEIYGWQFTPQQAVERLARHCRVWVITPHGGLSLMGGATDAAVVKELSTGYRQVEQWFGRVDVLLFVSSNTSCGSTVDH